MKEAETLGDEARVHALMDLGSVLARGPGRATGSRLGRGVLAGAAEFERDRSAMRVRIEQMNDVLGLDDHLT